MTEVDCVQEHTFHYIFLALWKNRITSALVVFEAVMFPFLLKNFNPLRCDLQGLLEKLLKIVTFSMSLFVWWPFVVNSLL